jgi:hypothetical protein
MRGSLRLVGSGRGKARWLVAITPGDSGVGVAKSRPSFPDGNGKGRRKKAGCVLSHSGLLMSRRAPGWSEPSRASYS